MERLAALLERLAAAGRTARLWWRDDDAAAPTPALDRLLALADRWQVPLALAVIPAAAGPALAERLAGVPAAAILQHGWAHRNHAAPDAKRAEFPDSRPAADSLADLAAGRERLRVLFGARPLPVLVPPWNRIGRRLAALLPERGYARISGFGADGPGPGPHTHLDPIDWRQGRGFVGAERALAALTARLEAAPDEPAGLLTHHLVQDEGCWNFLDRLLGLLRRSPAVRWPAPAALFGVAA